MKQHFLVQTLFALALMLFASTVNAEPLTLTKGTWTTVGHAQLKYLPGDISNMTSDNLGWNVDTGLGYFIMDNLDLSFKMSTGGRFTSPISGVSAGMAVGIEYFFTTDSCFSPYIGIAPGIVWQKRPLNIPDVWNLRVPVQGGVLMALNSRVALDFGLEASLDWELQTGAPNTTFFQAGVGYFGVRVFF